MIFHVARWSISQNMQVSVISVYKRNNNPGLRNWVIAGILPQTIAENFAFHYESLIVRDLPFHFTELSDHDSFADRHILVGLAGFGLVYSY